MNMTVSGLCSLMQTSIVMAVEQLPVFVKAPDEKHACVVCGGMLRPPVKQTICGHRMCSACASGLFAGVDGGDAGAAGTVPCPGGEEECELLRADELNPDNATTREVRNLDVYCSNKTSGCDVILKWSALAKHLTICAYVTLSCTNPGCGKSFLRLVQKQHLENDCEFAPVRCSICDGDIPRREFNNGHSAECGQKIRSCALKSLGCGFEGDVQNMKEHSVSEIRRHNALIMQSVNKITTISSTLSERVDDLAGTIEKRGKLSSHLDTEKELTTKLKSIEATVGTLTEELNTIGNKMQHYVTRSEFDQHAKQVQEIKTITATQENRISVLEEGRSIPNANADPKVAQLESTVGMHDHRLAEHELRFRLLETASFNGRLVWRIPDYTRRKRDAINGRTLSLYSQPFYSSHYGYKMCARVYLNGDGLGRGTHLSLFFVIMKGEYDALLQWPFRQRVTMSLLDQSGNRKHVTDAFRPDPTSSSFRKPVGDLNIASGSPNFAPHSKVESDSYLKDDTLYISLSIDTADLADPW